MLAVHRCFFLFRLKLALVVFSVRINFSRSLSQNNFKIFSVSRFKPTLFSLVTLKHHDAICFRRADTLTCPIPQEWILLTQDFQIIPYKSFFCTEKDVHKIVVSRCIMLHRGYLLVTSRNRLAPLYGNWSVHMSFLPSFFCVASQ